MKPSEVDCGGLYLCNQRVIQKCNPMVLALFLLCLVPLTYINSQGLGVSVNYIYLLIIPIIAKFKFYKNTTALMSCFFLSVCFLISIPYNYLFVGVDPGLLEQQCISFIIFTLPFVLLCVKLNDMELVFERALIIASLVYSLFALFYFFSFASSNGINPFEIKELMGDVVPDWPQRYVLILFAGFFYSFDYRIKSTWIALARVLIAFTIFITFLRAAYLAIFFGFFSYLWLLYKAGKLNLYKSRKVIYACVILFVGSFLITHLDTGLLDAGLSIVDYFLDSVDSFIGQRQEYNASDQARLDMWSSAFAAINPIFGLGGGGIYFVLPDVGSAHNQYFDYYVRFGLFGLMLFLYFNYRILSFYNKTKPWVVGIAISFLVFGVAHETTKFSYGSFIFFYILSLTFTEKNR
jgi:O-antigen ligase